MLDEITPLLITHDEAPNIERTLAPLEWAREIVVIDSGSTDGTLEILERHPTVRVVSRPFDSFASQLAFGLEESAISTPWVLALDADHVLTPELVEEVRQLDPAPPTSGYLAPFRYCIRGRPLRGSLYPPRIVLLRRQDGGFEDDGHGHRVVVSGTTASLRGEILHDDRKSFTRWVDNQVEYSRLEAIKLTSTPRRQLAFVDRVRLLGFLAPLLMLPYCLLVKRGILDGWAGWSYALQRSLAEVMLSIRIVESKLGAPRSANDSQRGPRD